MTWTIYLSGEIHTDWRQRIQQGAKTAGLDVAFTGPVTDHASSDHCGAADRRLIVLRVAFDATLRHTSTRLRRSAASHRAPSLPARRAGALRQLGRSRVRR